MPGEVSHGDGGKKEEQKLYFYVLRWRLQSGECLERCPMGTEVDKGKRQKEKNPPSALYN